MRKRLLEDEFGPEHTGAQGKDKADTDDDQGVLVQIAGAAPCLIAEHHSGLRAGGRCGDGEIGADDEDSDQGQDIQTEAGADRKDQRGKDGGHDHVVGEIGQDGRDEHRDHDESHGRQAAQHRLEKLQDKLLDAGSLRGEGAGEGDDEAERQVDIPIDALGGHQAEIEHGLAVKGDQKHEHDEHEQTARDA